MIEKALTSDKAYWWNNRIVLQGLAPKTGGIEGTVILYGGYCVPPYWDVPVEIIQKSVSVETFAEFIGARLGKTALEVIDAIGLACEDAKDYVPPIIEPEVVAETPTEPTV